MARIRQFAKDMGLSYNEAKNLVNKGRKLRDGGSSVLENAMNKVKPIKAQQGLYKGTPPATKEEIDKLNPKSAIDKLLELKTTKRKNRKAKVPDFVKGLPEKKSKKIRAKYGGSIKKMRGGGLAVQGLEFRGVR